jgi:hypothetical protein
VDQSETFNIQHSTFNIQHSTFNIQHSTFNIQHSGANAACGFNVQCANLDFDDWSQAASNQMAIGARRVSGRTPETTGWKPVPPGKKLRTCRPAIGKSWGAL